MTIEQYFGSEFKLRLYRLESYSFLEKFISQHHSDWATPPNTGRIVSELEKELTSWSDQKFGFLLCISGYIPEIYLPDSSQETLYSKLIEALIKEWAIRIGFGESNLPTQKASREDISIFDGNHTVVCDAKSFRLGRSQPAPNVKDVLKHADIAKWLGRHPQQNRLGGLVVLPKQHDWKRGSDYYQYTTDKELPTMSLYYEHLSFLLFIKNSKEVLVSCFKSYPKIFPQKKLKQENNRQFYYDSIEKQLFVGFEEEWRLFKSITSSISSECAFHTLKKLCEEIKRLKDKISEKYAQKIDIEQMRKLATESEFKAKSSDLAKQRDRIRKFRIVSEDYISD